MLHRITRGTLLLVAALCLASGGTAYGQGTIYISHEGTDLGQMSLPPASDLLSPLQVLEAQGGNGVAGVDAPDVDVAKDAGMSGGAVPPGPDGTWDRTDPAGTGCAQGAVTHGHVDINSGGTKVAVVELRYSPSCRTAWARITSSTTVCQKSGAACGNAWVVRDSENGLKLSGRSDLAPSCPAKTGYRGCYTLQVDDAGHKSIARGCMATSAGSQVCATMPWSQAF
jgi:hypothetical protein